MNTYTRSNRISEWLHDQCDFDLIEIWNHYQDENCYEEKIYSMTDLYVFIEGMEPLDIVKEFSEEDRFSAYDDYFVQDIYGWKSFDKCSDEKCPIWIPDLADWIDRTEDDCGYAELENILNGEDEEEDDEE